MRKRSLSVVSVFLVLSVLELTISLFVESLYAQDQKDIARIEEFPEPTVVLRLERIPNCKGCSSFEYTLYSDTSNKYVGHEAVFWLGYYGEYERIQEYRTLQPATPNDRGFVLGHRASYRNLLLIAADPNSWFGKRLAAVEKSEFFGHRSPSSADNSETDLQLTVTWKGKKNTVRYTENDMPSWFKQLVETVFLGYNFSAQPAARFWSDDDAVLWVSQGRWERICPSTTGLIVYRDGRVRIHGWNHVGVDQGYRDVVKDIGRERVAGLLAGFDRGIPHESAGRASYPGAAAASGLGDKGSDTRYLWHYKPKPYAFIGVSRNAWIGLRELWDEMRGMLGPNDPARVADCARRIRR